MFSMSAAFGYSVRMQRNQRHSAAARHFLKAATRSRTAVAGNLTVCAMTLSNANEIIRPEKGKRLLDDGAVAPADLAPAAVQLAALAAFPAGAEGILGRQLLVDLDAPARGLVRDRGSRPSSPGSP